MLASRVGVLVILGALELLGGAVGSADAATPCGANGVLSGAGTHFSCEYTTVGEDTFSVPAGLTSVSVVAIGAPGGNGGLYDSASADGAPGGFGAVVTAPSVPVAGAVTLYVEVGGVGGNGVGVNGSSGFCASGAAGVNGGGAGGTGRCAGGSGGGGGGESDVRTAPASSGGLTGGGGDPRLVVAGGGGGGGGEYYTAGGSGGSSGGASAGGAGAGGGVNCEALSATGMPGGSGETGPGGGAAGVVQNPGDCPTETAGGSAGTATSGGSGGNGDGNESTGPGGGGGGYYGGGGGVAVGGFDAPGGGGGSSYAPAGATFATAPSAATTPSVTISWVTSAPTVKISTPTAGAIYPEAQTVHSSFSCTEGGGPGIASCLDQNGNATGAAIDTSTVGAHTLTVTATSQDGLTGTAGVTYTVVARPLSAVAPAISGTAKAGSALSCSQGSWTNQPVAFAYQWNRDGTPLVGATSSTYTVTSLDEGTTLTCAVTASNVAGSDSITSGSVNVPVPYVPRCPAAAGPLSGGKLGSIRLGMTREEARRAYRHSSDRGERYEDFFCLTPIGIRVGYASPKLLATLPAPGRASVRGRVVWASTSNPRYAIMGVRPGAVLEAASRRLHVGKVLPIGLNDWYLAPAGSVTAVLKVRHGVVEEVGIADRALTLTRKRQTTFMHSFE
jgi:hypothetical protein